MDITKTKIIEEAEYVLESCSNPEVYGAMLDFQFNAKKKHAYASMVKPSNFMDILRKTGKLDITCYAQSDGGIHARGGYEPVAVVTVTLNKE